MNIGFDAKRLFHNHTGLGHYSRNIVHNLNSYFPENEYFLYASDIQKSVYKGHYLYHQIRNIDGGIKALKRSFGITKLVNNDDLDIYHGLSNELPLNASKIRAKKVVTIHDLFYETFPDDFTTIDRSIYKLKTEKACLDADKVIAITEATKYDILKYINIKESKIEVVYQTCHGIFQSKEPQLPPCYLPPLPSEFFMQVGTVNKRKNVISIIKALGSIPKGQRIPFVIVGDGKEKYIQELKTLIQHLKLEKEVFFIGSQPSKTLHYLYKKAKFVTLPSFSEGFGIPIIESLFCGTPVLTSNISAMPEALGKNGVLVNPSNLSEIKAGLKHLIDNQINIDKNHLEKFSAQATSNALMKLYTNL